MSNIDRQINQTSQSQNPKKYRGFLARMLLNHEVIIPTKVLEELQNIITTGIIDRDAEGNLGKIVHAGNKQDIQLIIDAMEGLTTPALPTRTDVIRQAAIWNRIKAMPNEQKRWITKFEPLNNRVQSAANSVNGIGLEPWLQAYKELHIRWDAMDHNLSPTLQKEAVYWENQMKKTWPDLIPDYEILLVAEANNAPVASRDRDYFLMWQASESLNKNTNIKPVFVKTVADTYFEETSVQKLGELIRKQVTPKHKKDCKTQSDPLI